MRPWRHSWVPSESCLEEGTCFFFWLWLLLVASCSDGAFSLWSHTLHRAADKGLSSTAKLVSGLSCKSKKLKPTLSWGWTFHFTLPWTSSLECQGNLEWIPFPFFPAVASAPIALTLGVVSMPDNCRMDEPTRALCYAYRNPGPGYKPMKLQDTRTLILKKAMKAKKTSLRR